MPTAEELAVAARYDLLLSYRNGIHTHVHAPAAPAGHAASHQNNGADEISVAGLSGLLADPQTPLAHTHDDRYYTEAESDARFEPIGAVAKRFPEHENVIATDYTLVAAKNAVMAGPMSTAVGATLTIESGAELVTV